MSRKFGGLFYNYYTQKKSPFGQPRRTTRPTGSINNDQPYIIQQSSLMILVSIIYKHLTDAVVNWLFPKLAKTKSKKSRLSLSEFSGEPKSSPSRRVIYMRMSDLKKKKLAKLVATAQPKVKNLQHNVSSKLNINQVSVPVKVLGRAYNGVKPQLSYANALNVPLSSPKSLRRKHLVPIQLPVEDRDHKSNHLAPRKSNTFASHKSNPFGSQYRQRIQRDIIQWLNDSASTCSSCNTYESYKPAPSHARVSRIPKPVTSTFPAVARTSAQCDITCGNASPKDEKPNPIKMKSKSCKEFMTNRSSTRNCKENCKGNDFAIRRRCSNNSGYCRHLQRRVSADKKHQSGGSSRKRK